MQPGLLQRQSEGRTRQAMQVEANHEFLKSSTDSDWWSGLSATLAPITLDSH